MITGLILLSALLFNCQTPSPKNVENATDYKWENNGESVALLLDGKTVWRHNHGESLTKPFFDPLGPAGGPDLAWDRPPDHAWHHGLWFCWLNINDVDYWKHAKKTGRPVGTTQWKPPIVDLRDDHSAIIEMDISYFPPDKKAAMTERRTMKISAPTNDGTITIDWMMVFTAGKEEVRLEAKGGYGGLSIRMAKGLQKRTACDEEAPIPLGTNIKTTGRTAVDYSGAVSGQKAGIAILGHPDNPRHPSPWYLIESTNNNFYWFNPAFLIPGNFAIPGGKTLTLRYRIIAHPDRWEPEDVKNAREAFLNGN